MTYEGLPRVESYILHRYSAMMPSMDMIKPEHNNNTTMIGAQPVEGINPVSLAITIHPAYKNDTNENMTPSRIKNLIRM